MTDTKKATPATEYPTLVAALAALQSELPTVRKGETAKVPTKAGGSYTYSYASLADMAREIYPLLSRAGLVYVARPTFRDDGKYVLVGELRHVSGEMVDGAFPLSSVSDPQALGSAITYGRRYLLGALTGVVTDDDDDGAKATEAHREQRQQRQQPPAETVTPLDADDWQRRVDAAMDITALSALAAELARAKSSGATDDATFQRLAEYGAQRKTELSPKEDAA